MMMSLDKMAKPSIPNYQHSHGSSFDSSERFDELCNYLNWISWNALTNQAAFERSHVEYARTTMGKIYFFLAANPSSQGIHMWSVHLRG